MRLRPLLVASLLLAGCAHVPPTKTPKPIPVDDLVRPFIEDGWVRGLSIALIHDGAVTFHGYGRAAAPGSLDPSPHTLFEIGSVTKVFTSTALALAVQRGSVALDTPVSRLLPSACVPVDANARQVTLLELATHTSGLPRVPKNLSPANPNDPYADYTPARLCAFMSTLALPKPPPAVYAYSNLGAGLLGDALSQKAGTSYERLIEDTIAGPLGLTETVITLTPEQRERFATGSNADLETVGPWSHDALAGAGALRSTASDLAKLVIDELSPPSGPLGDAMAMTRKAQAPRPGGAVGLGWHLGLPGMPDGVWHNGQTGGFHAFIAFDPRAKVGVVLLADTATSVVDALGIALLHVLDHAPYSVVLPAIIRLTPAALDRFVGRYTLAPGVALTIARGKDALTVQLTGQPRFRIYPVSETRFVLRAVEASLAFEVPAAGPAVAVVLHQNGRELRATRAP
ncbi:MAG: serine hydrolase [Deltaproteobacteria bacterium]